MFFHILSIAKFFVITYWVFSLPYQVDHKLGAKRSIRFTWKNMGKVKNNRYNKNFVHSVLKCALIRKK